MDLDHFENVLAGLELKNEKIKSAAEICLINNVNSEYEIAKILERHFKGSSSQGFKTAIFFVISQILLVSNQKKDKTFFKALSQKIKGFIEDLAMNVTELELAYSITKVLEKWTEDQIFSSAFIEKLKATADPLYTRVNEEKQLQSKNETKFNKYKKTFLMELQDIKDFKATDLIYEGYVDMADLMNKLGSFNQAYSKLNLENSSNPSQQTIQRAKQLEKAALEYQSRLLGIICSYHQSYKELRKSCKEELDRLDN